MSVSGLPGRLVVDSCCLSHLARPAARLRFHEHLDESNLVPAPSAINALEVARCTSPEYREHLQDTLRFLSGGRGLLPSPRAVLKDVGRALAHGLRWRPEAQRLNGPFDRPAPSRSASQLHEDADQSDNAWRLLFQQKRSALRPLVPDPRYWPNARSFVNQVSADRTNVRAFVSALWSKFGLAGDAPVDALLGSRPWRMFLDIVAFMAYEMSVLRGSEPKQVQVNDLYQLIYLVDAERALLVTEDEGLLRAGTEIVNGRYPGAQVVKWAAFN